METIIDFTNPTRTQDLLIGRFIQNCLLTNVLLASNSRVYHQTEVLVIPNITADDIVVDKKSNTVFINVQDVPDDVSSATSITKDMKTTYTTDELRTFAHDFTFMIVSDKTDQRFDSVFPPEKDLYDHRTPDLFIINDLACLLLEFSTSRNDQEYYLQRAFEVKEFAYLDAYKRRVNTASKLGVCKKYGFSPLIISTTKCMVSKDLWIPRALVNELCARYRFALNVLAVLSELGVQLEETEFSQIRTDLKMSISSIVPDWQKDDGSIQVPLSRERVITDDITSTEALNFARTKYLKMLKSNLRRVSRKPNETNPCGLWSKLLKANLGTRTDQRSILQLPSHLPRKRFDDLVIPSAMFASNEYADLWDEAIDHMRTVDWSNEFTKEELIDIAMKPGDITSESNDNRLRRRYKRVKIPLSNSQRIEFGKVGVQGKQLRNDLEVQDYRLRKKEAFSLNTCVEDIDRFINDDSLMDAVPDKVKHIDRVTSLVDHALGVHEPTHRPGSEMLSAISRDKLFQWASFISDLGSELCVSIKQNVGHDEFVLKALKNWHAFLLIKPTNSDSHIFYTVLIPREGSSQVLPDSIGKRGIVVGDNLIFPWMSYSVSKLVNCIKAESFFISMLSQWSRYYEMDSQSGSRNKSVRRMLNLSLLVHLEDKPKTEEILTLFRYISMEKFSLTTPDNTKMLEKIPPVIRSRLQVWVIRKLVVVMVAPNYEPTIDEQTEGLLSKKDRKWLNMVNPYTEEVIDYPQKLIELYYLGYCTNKDAKSWPNTEFDLVKKIVKYEIELEKTDPKLCGLVESDDDTYKIHEWSRRMNCAGADSIKRLLTVMYSDGYVNHLEEQILTRLSRLTWEQVATLKASSTFNPHTDPVRDQSGKHKTKRIKVLVAVLRHQGELADTPAKSLNKVLDWIDKDGGLRVDIFKKNQHGGLREIYVLELHSRILQLCLEEISRAICHEIPIEMMTHSQNKISKPQEHMYAAALDKSSYKVNISSSNDAKVWNQGHHVAKFCQFMCRLLPSAWHGLLVNGLKQWTTRKIGLPDGVLDLIRQMEVPLLRDPIHAEIRSAYLGLTKRSWMKQGESFLRIESGMMQGILHYMSSLFHCGVLLLRDSLWKSIIKTTDIRCRTLDLVSSDDSSRMTDIGADTPKMLMRGKIFSRADHALIKDFSPMFGIHMSSKSTYSSNGVMEFNSEFFFRASLYRPTLKWAYASLNVVEVESLVERQEVMYSLITQLLEAGSGFRQAHETQVAQAFLHYRLLGCSVNPLFSSYCSQLVEVQDPALGYFFMDHPLCAGLPGYQYNVWMAVTKNDLLSSLYADLLAQGDLTTTTSGQIVRSCQVRFGNRQRAMKIIDEAEKVCPSWREDIEKTPMVLYQVARDIRTSLLKILVKLTSPSVIRALSKGNSVARMLASSVYLINGMATSVGSNWNHILDEKLGKIVKKVSLWYLLQQSLLHETSLTQEQIRVLFPLRDYYANLSNLMKTLDKYALVPGGSRKMLRSNVLVYPDPPSLPFNLEQMVRWMWFGENLPASRTTLMQVWELYSATYAWLRNSPEATLKAGGDHFESHIQLRNFIARQAGKSRSVHLTGAPVRDSGSQDLIYCAITRNQMTMKVLVPPSLSHRPDLTNGDSTMSAIAGLMTFPLKEECKIQLIKKELNESSDLWDGGPVRPSNRKTRLGVIQHFIKRTDAGRICSAKLELEFNKILKDSKMGVVGGFVRRQKFEESTKEWRGTGKWCGMVGDASVDLYIDGSVLTSIVTNSIEKLRESQHMLKNLLVDFGITSFSENTFSNLSPINLYYDINQIRADRVGAPIRCNQIMANVSNIRLSALALRITDNSLRIVHVLPNKMVYTLVSYKTVAADFKFNKPVHSHLNITKAWLNNHSLDTLYAEKMLMKGMSSEVSVNIDKDSFRTFVSDTIVPALHRAGMRFNTSKLGSDTAIAKELDLSEVLLIGEDNEDFLDFGDDYSFIEQAQEEVESHVTDLEFEPFDIVMGEVLLTESNRDLIPIHHVHKIWDNYALGQMTSLSRADVSRIEKGFLPRSGECSLTKFLEYYVGWTFVPHEPGVLKSCEVLETLDEEF